MDFVSGLPLTQKKHDVVWVIVDRLTKSAHFLSVRTDYSLKKLAELYISEIVTLYGIPISIISNRDSRFNLDFGRSYKKPWVHNSTIAQFFILKRMDSRNG